ncbi:hypothetical protein [Cellulosilyticum ruminicola]|uniref:hypothetical protein n=1 Tax=Cellulosilyticum ruminicola TaxID=425254 RepID=UPI0006D1B4A1|nr:hypothetical protein [Cellulosilyticum ruminicola]
MSRSFISLHIPKETTEMVEVAMDESIQSRNLQVPEIAAYMEDEAEEEISDEIGTVATQVWQIETDEVSDLEIYLKHYLIL